MKANRNGHGGGQGGHPQGTSEASRLKSIEANHEVSDVELRGIIVFLIGLTVMTVVVYLLMLLMFNLLNSRETETKGHKPPLALSEKERLPPEPRLQSAPGFAQQLEKEVGVKKTETALEKDKPKDRTFELDQLQKKWADELKYGPTDQNGKPNGISIEEAMKQVLEGNGLPTRTPSPPGAGGPQSFAVEMPTAASSGRMTEKRKE